MKNKYNIILILLLMSFAFNANAAYYSLHQYYGGIYNKYKPQDYAGSSSFTYSVKITYREATIPGDLKIFIPPGTTAITGEMLKQYEGYKIGYAERYKSAPSCSGCNYNSAPWDSHTRDLTHYVLSYMKDHDVYSKNIGGTAYLADYIGFNKPLSVADSGWYYIHKFGQGSIQQVEFNLSVKSDVYFAWRNDPNTCWNSSGDPCDTGDNPAPPPETCDSRHLDKCNNATSCSSAGGYFYDDDNDGVKTCNESKPCDTVDTCNSNNSYGASECNMSGFYYYEHACFVQPACTTTSDCAPDNCTYEASGEGFYYYDANGDGTNECNSRPQNQCDQHHPELCTNESSCEKYLNKWCNGTCYAAYQSTACDTPAGGGGSGGSTGGGSSGSIGSDCSFIEMMTGTCGSSGGSGGSSGGSSGSSGGSTCTPFEQMFGGCNKTVVCDNTHPEECKDENSCESKGHIWCNDTCYATDSSNLPDECKIVCNSDQVHFASYYKGQKIEACLPKNLKYLPQFDNGSEFDAVKSLNKEETLIKRYAFPLYVGDDLVDDGKINNGDKLNLKARLYPLTEPYDLYLALVYQGDDNKTIVIFFKKNGNTWTAQADPIPFVRNILPSDNYTESNFGSSFDFCQLLNGASPLTGDFTIWYLAFPTSDRYTDNMQGLLKRYQEQKHSIEYYILNNNCDFDSLNNDEGSGGDGNSGGSGGDGSGVCDEKHKENCTTAESCDRVLGIWCASNYTCYSPAAYNSGCTQ